MLLTKTIAFSLLSNDIFNDFKMDTGSYKTYLEENYESRIGNQKKTFSNILSYVQSLNELSTSQKLDALKLLFSSANILTSNNVIKIISHFSKDLTTTDQRFDVFKKFIHMPSIHDFVNFLRIELRTFSKDKLSFLRAQLVGRDATFEGPWGKRMIHYSDWTASGRALHIVNRFMSECVDPYYANSHTEDSTTGLFTTRLMEESEDLILNLLGASKENYACLALGTGSSGPLNLLQQILGIHLPPKTKLSLLRPYLRKTKNRRKAWELLKNTLRKTKDLPLVLFGPMEHHTSVVPWRLGLCDSNEIELKKDGDIDLHHLEQLLKNQKNYSKIYVSVSAGSNVTGRLANVKDIVALCKKYSKSNRKVIPMFDFAAIAPYVPTNIEKSGIASYISSPHKFIGGPGASGLAIIRKDLYDRSLAPNGAGGGTVDGVGQDWQLFIKDISAREKNGTPGPKQIALTAIVYAIKDLIGHDVINNIEHKYCDDIIQFASTDPNIDILDKPTPPNKPGRVNFSDTSINPRKRVPIISFNIRHTLKGKYSNGKYFHPRFLAVLVDKLFGEQMRAGCSCAGPYGHRLFGISKAVSSNFKSWIDQKSNDPRDRQFFGHKPGWLRFNAHFTFTQKEIDSIKNILKFLTINAEKFLPLFNFNPLSGAWTLKKDVQFFKRNFENVINMSFENAKKEYGVEKAYEMVLDAQMELANEIASNLPKTSPNEFHEVPYWHKALSNFYVHTNNISKESLHYLKEKASFLKEIKLKSPESPVSSTKPDFNKRIRLRYKYRSLPSKYVTPRYTSKQSLNFGKAQIITTPLSPYTEIFKLPEIIR